MSAGPEKASLQSLKVEALLPETTHRRAKVVMVEFGEGGSIQDVSIRGEHEWISLPAEQVLALLRLVCLADGSLADVHWVAAQAIQGSRARHERVTRKAAK